MNYSPKGKPCFKPQRSSPGVSLDHLRWEDPPAGLTFLHLKPEGLREGCCMIWGRCFHCFINMMLNVLCVRSGGWVGRERGLHGGREYTFVESLSLLPPFLPPSFLSPLFPSVFLLETTDQLDILWQFPEDELQIFVERAGKKKKKRQRKTRKTKAKGGKKRGGKRQSVCAHTHTTPGNKEVRPDLFHEWAQLSPAGLPLSHSPAFRFHL